MGFGPVFPRTFSVFERDAAVANWWEVAGKTCVAAYCPKNAASLAASYLRIAGSGGNEDLDPAVLGKGVAPTFNAATGWGFSNAAWLDSGIIGGNGYSATIRIANAGAVYTGCFGETRTGYTFLNLYPNYAGAGSKAYFRNGGSYDQASPYTAGVFCVTPAKAYANGTALGSMTGSLNGTTTYKIALGGQILNGGVGETWTGNILAFALHDGTLTDGEVETLSAAMAAL
jgi:hypothetical protein